MPGCCALNVILRTAGSGAARRKPRGRLARLPAWLAVNLLPLLAGCHRSSRRVAVAFWLLRQAGTIREVSHCRRDACGRGAGTGVRAAGAVAAWRAFPRLTVTGKLAPARSAAFGSRVPFAPLGAA